MSIQKLVTLHDEYSGKTVNLQLFRRVLRDIWQSRWFPSPIRDWFLEAEQAARFVRRPHEPPLNDLAAMAVIEAGTTAGLAAVRPDAQVMLLSNDKFEDLVQELVDVWPDLNPDRQVDVLNSPVWWERIWLDGGESIRRQAKAMFDAHPVTWSIAFHWLRGFDEWWNSQLSSGSGTSYPRQYSANPAPNVSHPFELSPWEQGAGPMRPNPPPISGAPTGPPISGAPKGPPISGSPYG